MLDEVKDLKNKYSEIKERLRQAKNESDRRVSDLEEILKHTQEESRRRIEEATNASEDKIEELSMRNNGLLRRVKKAEEREAEWEERVDVLLRGQPGPSVPGPSSGTNPATSSSRPHPSAPFVHVHSSTDDDEATRSRWQRASGATRAPRKRREPQKRTPWSDNDTETLIQLIACHGAYYSKLEKLWKHHLPNCHPRDQKQIKDKARNLKVFYLK